MYMQYAYTFVTANIKLQVFSASYKSHIEA